MVQPVLVFLVQFILLVVGIALLTEALVEWYRVLLVEPTIPPSKTQQRLQRLIQKIPIFGQAQGCGFCLPVWVSCAVSILVVVSFPELLLPAACAWPVASRGAHFWHDVMGKTTAHKVLAQRQD